MDLEKLDYSYDEYMHIMLRNKYKIYGIAYSKISNIDILKKVYNLWYFNNEYEPKFSLEYHHLSHYYRYYKKDNIYAEILFNKAVEMNEPLALNNLAIKYFHRNNIDDVDNNKDCNKAIEILSNIESCDVVNFNLASVYYVGCNECGISQDIEKAKDYSIKYPDYPNNIRLLYYYYSFHNNFNEHSKIIINGLKNKIIFPDICKWLKIYMKDNIKLMSLIDDVEKFHIMLQTNIYSECQFGEKCDSEICELQFKNDHLSLIKLSKIYINYEKKINMGISCLNKAYDINSSDELFDKIMDIVKNNKNIIMWKPNLHKFWNDKKRMIL